MTSTSKLNINFGPDFINKTALSPSRIDTYAQCSQKYYANYFLKIPDKGNFGSLRGSTCHDVMEFLAQNENRALREELRKCDTLVGTPIWEKTVSLATQYKVADKENIDLIDQFLITALRHDTQPKNTREELAEVPFDFEVTGNGINFRVRGKMDKIYIINGGDDKESKSLYVNYLDYKSSKAKFSKDKIEGNLQGGIYQYAINVLYPELELKRFDFLFLKFGDKPIQEFKLLSEVEMDGFLLYLTDVQESLNKFSESNVGDNLGILKFETKFLCGPAKTGWICPHQLPLEYFVIVNELGEIITSGFTEEELTPKLTKTGLKIEKRKYPGCLYFFNKEGKRRKLSYGE